MVLTVNVSFPPRKKGCVVTNEQATGIPRYR